MIARFLVEKHWKIAQVVLPASFLFGFMYTLKTGEAPFRSLSEGTPSAVKAGALPLHSVSMKFNWSDGDK